MSGYTEALTELAALPGRLQERLARSEREIAAERERRGAEIDAASREHKAVVERLEAVIVRARGEGVDLHAVAGEDHDPHLDSEPVEYARQLVDRLEGALEHYVYTRDALAAEEEKLGEAERRRLAEERLRRERDELRRREEWERARQGTTGLLIGLGVVTAGGLVAGLLGTAAVLALPVAAALVCFALAAGTTSTLSAQAVRRAAGTMPLLPDAPARETRLAAAGYAAAALGLCALGIGLTSSASGIDATLAIGVLVLCAGSITGLGLIWALLPQRR